MAILFGGPLDGSGMNFVDGKEPSTIKVSLASEKSFTYARAYNGVYALVGAYTIAGIKQTITEDVLMMAKSPEDVRDRTISGMRRRLLDSAPNCDIRSLVFETWKELAFYTIVLEMNVLVPLAPAPRGHDINMAIEDEISQFSKNEGKKL